MTMTVIFTVKCTGNYAVTMIQTSSNVWGGRMTELKEK